MSFVIVPDVLVDGSGEPALTGQAVAIESGRIADLGQVDEVLGRCPTDIAVVPGVGCSLIPGLIDAHVHLGWGLTGQEGWSDLAKVSEGRFAWALAGSQAALAVGVTTQRDCGSPDLGVLRLRDAVKMGIVTGPSIVASGPCVTTTNGHGDFIGLTADSASELRCRVDELHDAGVDFIKVMASGGDMDPQTNRRKPQYSSADLRVLVERAHDLSLAVVAHCNPTASIRQAVDAGVDTIAHCNWLGEAEGTIDYDPELACRMIERGTFIDLNVEATIRPYVVGDGSSQAWTEEFHPKNRWETHATLRSQGARIIFTSDEFGFATAKFPSLLERAVRELGVDILEVIHRSTALPAQAIGLGDEVGTIRIGQKANLALLEGDLTIDPATLRRARTVWVDGRIAMSLGRISSPPVATISGAHRG